MNKMMFLLFLLATFVNGQELNADVNVNYEQLPTAAKERLVDFELAVEDYLSTTRFTDLEWEGDPIKCSFNIFFTSSGGETQYSAQVVINSQRPIYKSNRASRMMTVMDKEWSFEYEKNQPLRFDLFEFNPLTSFLDFYAFLIIGYDMDSYNPLGGTNFYKTAFDITLLGARSTFSKGWAYENNSYNKRKLLDEIQDASFNRFRTDFFDYHYNGLDLYSENKKLAQKNMAKLVNNLYEVIDQIARNSVILKVFFDAKAGELVDYLDDYNDEIFAKLMKINPENISKYEKAME